MFCKDCVTAKKKFRKGDKVVLSADGCIQMPEMIEEHSYGTVVGFGRALNLVRVVTHGTKTPASFHAGFWERV